MTYDTSKRNTRIARDVTVLSCAPAPNSGQAGTPIDYIGDFETVEFSPKREFGDTTGSAQGDMSSRAVRFGKGTVKMTGYSRGASSKLAQIFAASSHALFQFQESATGDAWQFLCTCEDFSKSIGKEATKDSLSLGQEGTPLYGPAGGALAPMVLES